MGFESCTVVFLAGNFFRHCCCRMYRSAAARSEINQTAEISASGIATAVWSHDHGYSRRVIFGGLVLGLYYRLYKVRSTIGLYSDSYASCSYRIIS